MSFKIHCSPLALATPADTGFLVLLPCICHWFCLCRKSVSLKWNGHFLFGPLLSMTACVRTPMKRWASQAAWNISNTMCPCFSQSCAVLSLGLKHVFARHRGVAYHCWAGESVPGSAYVVLDGENGWIAKWKRGRKPDDLCTCFRLEGSMGQDPAFESAHLELGWA